MGIRFVTTRPAGLDVWRYAIFETGWGFMGLLGWEDNISRLVLPDRDESAIRKVLDGESTNAKQDDKFVGHVQRDLIDYFNAKPVQFDCTLDISWASDFARQVLRCCSRIKPGRTVSYGELAGRINRASAARAVGAVMARNRVPLIIPCHRVIAAGGRLGGFSAAGSVDFKKRLLQHEGAKITKFLGGFCFVDIGVEKST